MASKKMSEKNEQPLGAVGIPRGGPIVRSKPEPRNHVNGGKKKTVRFRMHEGEDYGYSNAKCGAVRIRVLVTQRELIQILTNNESKHSSMEQLLSVVKTERRKICWVGTSDGGWRPGLESILEE